MNNKVIHKKNIEHFIENYIKDSEGTRVYSSVFYYYYCIINHKEPLISYKSFISLFYKIYEKLKNKKLSKNSIRYLGTTLRTIDDIELIVPNNIINLLNEKGNNKESSFIEFPKQNTLSNIIEISKSEDQQHSKEMFDADMREWLLTYCKPEKGKQVKASIFIQHFSDKYLNGIEIKGNYNQFFFKALRKEAKTIWPHIEIKNENPSKKKGSAIIVNLSFK